MIAGGGIGERLRQARKDAGLSQADLARFLRVSRQTVVAWERGKHTPHPAHLARVHEVLPEVEE